MKTLRLIGMAFVAVIMSVNFAACSDDDDESGTAIEGTWKITSSFDEDIRSGGSCTFKSDGSLIWDDGEETSSNSTYTLKGDKLKIVLNQDDYLEGTISISGKQATYKYTWHDYDGKWDDDTEYTITLVKQ